MNPTGVEAPPTTGTARPVVVDDQAEDQTRETSYDNPEHVKTLVQRCIKDAASNPARQERDQADMYNLRFYRGGSANQWIYRSPTSGEWEERPFTGDDGVPAWVHRATSNDFANRIDGITAIFSQTDPAKSITAASDEDADVAAAEVAERGLPVCEDEIGWPALKRQIAHLCGLTSAVAVVYYYDNDPKHGTAELEVLRCAECAADPQHAEGGLLEPFEVEEAKGTCPDCGSEAIEIAMDPTQPGKPLTLRYARGKLCADLVNSLGFSLPKGATTFDAGKNPWVLLHNRWETGTAIATWRKHKEAILRAADSKSGRANPSNHYAEELRTMSSPTSSSTSGSGDLKGTVLIYRLQHDPIEDEELNFPEGLYAVMCGETVLEAGPLPFEDSRTGRRRKSILITTFREMPGSPYGKPPADDLAPLQVSMNLLESLTFISAMMHAAPQTFLPDTVTLIDELTGRPGQVTRFRSPDPSAKPHLQQGAGVHPSTFELMDRYEAKMDKLSGLNAVLQGDRPEGDPTLGETQILQERGMSQFRTPLDVRIDFEKEQSILLLDIARQSMWSPRFRKVMGENGKWQTEQFLGTDLTGNVDISIDPITAWPKSPMMQDLRLKGAVELGILAPAQDPEVASEALTSWNLTNFKKSLTEDQQQVARELDRWRAATTPQQIAMPDLAAIEVPFHLFKKKQFLKSEIAERLRDGDPANGVPGNRPVWDAMVRHVQMLMAAMQPAPMADGAAGKPDPAGAVNAAVQSGALVPEGAGGDPLQNAITGGALSPEMPAGPTGPSMDQLIDADVLTPAPMEAPPS